MTLSVTPLAAAFPPQFVYPDEELLTAFLLPPVQASMSHVACACALVTPAMPIAATEMARLK